MATKAMKTITDSTKTPDKAMLKTWYEESIALVQPLSSKQNNTETAAAAHWHTGLGILLVSNIGEEIRASGNAQACRAFIKKEIKSIFSENGMRVEQFENGIIIAECNKVSVRIIYADQSTLLGVLSKKDIPAELPNSECSLLLQILCGMSLKEASEADGVSYETKRSQFKSLAARTGFTSQSDVIRNTLLSLISFALDLVDDVNEPAPEKTSDAEAFLSIYYPGIFRYHQISLGKGRMLRIAETGPIDGEAVVWLHSQTLPIASQFISDWTHKTKIRLIIPFRNGFLENYKQRYSDHEHIENCVQDIAKVIELFCQGNARIVASSTGAAYGANLAENFPDHVKKLTICAAAYVGRYENKPISRIVNGFKNLAMKNDMLIAKSFDRYITKMSTQAGALEVLRTSYKNSTYDMGIFEDLLSNRMGHSWIYETYRTSRYSVIMDIIIGGYDVWQNANKIKCPVLFVHGRSDPINSIEGARNVASLFKKPEFVELQEDGQSLFLHRFSDLISLKNKQDYRNAGILPIVD